MEFLESDEITAAIQMVKSATKLNAEIQSKLVYGSIEWHRLESVDDKLFDALILLGD